jgi:plasmid maintenance system antidote protein VapI
MAILKMALRLTQLFENSPEFWLKAQRAADSSKGVLP